MRKVFDLEITDPIVEAIIAHAERDYPNEACGVVLGTAQKLVRVTPLANEQDKYHQHDPKAFPRTAKHAFRMNELERMRVLDAASEEGLDERIIYHSHCDVGAYFSPEDRAMAVQDGIELSPGVVHLVVSVRDGAKAGQDCADLCMHGRGDAPRPFGRRSGLVVLLHDDANVGRESVDPGPALASQTGTPAPTS